MAISVICDFDDTATLENVAHLLFSHYTPEESARLRRRYRRGEITFREYQETGFNNIAAPIYELGQYAAERARLRPGFGEMVAAARMTGGECSVVSDGVDFYVRAVLDHNGFSDIPSYSVTSEQGPPGDQPIRYDYPFGSSNCEGTWATCKCSVIDLVSRGQDELVFVGDGAMSDACASKKADMVFARDRLLRHCREADIPARPFDDLHTVAEYVRERHAALGRSRQVAEG